MALEIDTITQNKSVFNPQNDLNATGAYGIWDLTKGSMTYNTIPILINSFFTVTEYFQMRPDLISAIKLGDQGMVGSLLKFNAISNPFALKEGMTLAIPDKETVKESFRVKKIESQKLAQSNTNTNPNNAFKKNQEQKKFKVSEGRKKFLQDKIKNKPELNLPPNVLQPGEKTILKDKGFFIFAPDAGGGGFNTPQTS
jgi:hypothetical protein